MRIIKFYLGIFILIITFSIFSQRLNYINNEQKKENILDLKIMNNSEELEWFRTWGGVSWDGGAGIAVDSSDNIYITGMTKSFEAGNYDDIVLVKYNQNGVQQWNCTWGGNSDDGGRAVAVDSSDNVYITGYSKSFGAGSIDVILVKYNQSGVQQWNRTWGGVSWDRGAGIAVDSCDNVYITGETESFGEGSSDIILVKYNENGVQQWNRTWGGISWDRGAGIAVDSCDNVYITGMTISFGAGGSDVFLMKYDENGILQWNCTWGGSFEDSGYGVAVDSSDNIYVTGILDRYGSGNTDMTLVKYNENGIVQWDRRWSLTYYDSLNIAYGIAIDSSDNVYISGCSMNRNFDLSFNITLLKYNKYGTQQWSWTWGGSSDDYGYGVALDSSNNVYVTGATNSFGVGENDIILVKYHESTTNSGYSYFPFVVSALLIIIILCILIFILYFFPKKTTKN